MSCLCTVKPALDNDLIKYTEYKLNLPHKSNNIKENNNDNNNKQLNLYPAQYLCSELAIASFRRIRFSVTFR